MKCAKLLPVHRDSWNSIWYLILTIKAARAAETVAGDISRRKKVKEKRPSPFLLSKYTIFDNKCSTFIDRFNNKL